MNELQSDFQIRFDSVKLPVVLAVVAAILASAYVVSQLLLAGCDDKICRETTTFFALSKESNLPTWYSTMCWLLAAMLCTAAAKSPLASELRLRGYWIGLAALGVFLSMDEAAMFHERFGTVIGKALGGGGLGLYEWQAYGALLVIVVAMVFLPFLSRLPDGTRRRLYLAFGLFVSGALGVESIEALFLSHDALYADSAIRDVPMINGVLFLIEELLEMLGIIAWIHAILHFLKDTGSRAEIGTSFV